MHREGDCLPNRLLRVGGDESGGGLEEKSQHVWHQERKEINCGQTVKGMGFWSEDNGSVHQVSLHQCYDINYMPSNRLMQIGLF